MRRITVEIEAEIADAAHIADHCSNGGRQGAVGEREAVDQRRCCIYTEDVLALLRDLGRDGPRGRILCAFAADI